MFKSSEFSSEKLYSLVNEHKCKDKIKLLHLSKAYLKSS